MDIWPWSNGPPPVDIIESIGMVIVKLPVLPFMLPLTILRFLRSRGGASCPKTPTRFGSTARSWFRPPEGDRRNSRRFMTRHDRRLTDAQCFMSPIFFIIGHMAIESFPACMCSIMWPISWLSPSS